MSIHHFMVRNAILPSEANTIVKTMELPSSKFASGTRRKVRTMHSSWSRESRNGVLYQLRHSGQVVESTVVS